MATCLNGHVNPDHYRYCGECGAPLAAGGTATYTEPFSVIGGPPPVSPGSVPWPYAVPGPTSRTRRTLEQRRNIVVLAILGAVVAVVAVAIVIAVASGDKDSARSTPSSSTASSLDDWKSAVCQPGTYFNGGGHLRNADGGSASCQSINGVVVLIGQYTSNFDWRNDVAIFRGASYAFISDTDGTCVFVSPTPGARGASALEPLRQFGFQISGSGSPGY